MGLLDLLDVVDDLANPRGAHERRQDRRIAEAREAALSARAAAERSQRLRDLGDDASEARLRATIARQDRTITELSVALTVLVELLRDRHGFDQTVFRYRVEGELAALDEGEPADDVADAVSDQHAGGEPGTTKLCRNCKGEFPLAQTVVTDHGVYCDRCHLATTF